MSHQYLKAE